MLLLNCEKQPGESSIYPRRDCVAPAMNSARLTNASTSSGAPALLPTSAGVLPSPFRASTPSGCDSISSSTVWASAVQAAMQSIPHKQRLWLEISVGTIQFQSVAPGLKRGLKKARCRGKFPALSCIDAASGCSVSSVWTTFGEGECRAATGIAMHTPISIGKYCQLETQDQSVQTDWW